MLAAIAVQSAAFAPTTGIRSVTHAAANVKMETVADLKELATQCNPVVGYWNPLCLGESSDGASYDTDAAIGYLRHAEIKHGRIAMAAFVGFIVQSNNIHFPWMMSNKMGISYADIAAAGGPAAQWDALPTIAKLQIFGLIFFLEVWGEGKTTLAAAGEKHYMRGGKPGFYPPFSGLLPHPVPFNLFDPFGLSKNASPEKKARGLVAEINNGRLAQIGIIAFCSEARVPGSVPALSGLITPYSGECMAPFSSDTSLPFVEYMNSLPSFLTFAN